MDRLSVVMVGVDFSPRSVLAAQMGKMLAESNDADLVLIHAIENVPRRAQAEILGMPLDQLEAQIEKEASAELEIIAQSLEYPRTLLRVLRGRASEVLSAECAAASSSLLVVGDVGQSYSEGESKTLGSTALRLLRSIHCKLLIARPDRDPSIRRVAAAVCLEENGRCTDDEILEQAKALASAMGASVDVVNVFSTYYIDHMRRFGGDDEYTNQTIARYVEDTERSLETLVGSVDWGGVEVRCHVLTGSSGSELIRFARAYRTDVMVLGASRLSGFAQHVIGSTAQQVIQHSPSSVLVVGGPKYEE